MKKRNENLMSIHSKPTLIIGVDIAKKTHWARMLDGRTGLEVGHALHFHNSIDGFTRLLGKIGRVKEQTGAEKVVVAMEPSGHYWKPLAAYLTRMGLP